MPAVQSQAARALVPQSSQGVNRSCRAARMKHSLSRSRTRLLYMGRLLPQHEQETSGCTAALSRAERGFISWHRAEGQGGRG